MQVCTHVSELVASHEPRCPKCMQRKEMFPISEGVGPNLHCQKGPGVQQNSYLFQNPRDANLSLWPGRPRTTKRIHPAHHIKSYRTSNTAIEMQTTMANTMNLSLSRAAPLSSVRRCTALAIRPARLVRNSRFSVRAEADKSVKAQTPDVDRSKIENIEPGNISNEAAEKRADIGKERPPTPTGITLLKASHRFPTICSVSLFGSLVCR